MKWDAGTAHRRRIAISAAVGQWQSPLVAIVGFAFALRLVYSAQVDLLPEETYYWSYSRHLDFGYLDHPPLVAWLIRLGTSVFGDTEFGVRCGALVCGVTASVFVFRLTRNLFGERAALAALILAQVLPFFFMSGLLMTPDAPLTAAWAASLYFLERALIAGQGRAWLWAGLAIGVGMLSKYTIALLGLAALVHVLLDPGSRRWLRRSEPYAAVAIAAAVFSPVILWNSQHDWASFAFQTSRRLAEGPRFSVHKLIGAALVLLTPTGLVAVAAALIRGLPAGIEAPGGTAMRRGWRLLTVCVLVPVTVFLIFSLRHEVKLDWTGAPWVAALPLLAVGIAQAYGRRVSGQTVPAPVEGSPFERRLQAAWPPTIVVMLLIYTAGLYYMAVGLPGVGYSKHTELVPVAWHEFGRQIEDLADDVRRRNSGQVLVVGMDRYFIASESAFYSSDRPRALASACSANLFGEVGLMYEQWCPAAGQSGRTLLVVAWDAAALSNARLQKHADRLDAMQTGTLMRNGAAVRTYFYRVLHGYRPDARSGG